VVAAWATALVLVALGLYFSHRYRTFVPATFGPRRLFEYGVLLAVLTAVVVASAAVRDIAARLGRDRGRTVRRAVSVAAAVLAVLVAASVSPRPTSPLEARGLQLMQTLARTVPCDARMLVNVRTAGSFEVLAGRTSIDEGMAPYLRPSVLRQVLPVVLGAKAFFKDPLANRAYIDRERIDVVVAVTQAKVGGRPLLNHGRRPVLNRIPWLRPLVKTPGYTIYATPSLAEGAKSCYKTT
jgi:hypothetical protein